MLFPLPLRAALILYHIQNRLSSTFFKFFQKFFLCRSLLRDSFNIISLSFLFVKYFFQAFFKKFFRDQLRSLSRQLNYYITFSFLCQAIFKKFFNSSLSSSRNGLRLLFLFFFSLQSKSNILLTLSRGHPRSTVMLLYTFSSPLSSKRMDKYILVFLCILTPYLLFCVKFHILHRIKKTCCKNAAGFILPFTLTCTITI